MLIATVDDRSRSWALIVLCAGLVLIAVNTTSISVALPSIGFDLNFSETSLVWIVSAYLSTFGGCLLVGGCLGDVFGSCRVFLLGIALFTVASLVCAFAASKGVLVAARSLQGLAGALVSATAIAQVVNVFTDVSERAKALGACAFVGASGGSVGLLLGGALTSALGWRWIFVVSAFIGVGVGVLGYFFLSDDNSKRGGGRLNVVGAIAATAALTLALYVIFSSRDAGWWSIRTFMCVSAAAGLLLLLLVCMKGRSPLSPRKLCERQNVVAANFAGALLAAAALCWSFVSALYLQLVMQLSPIMIALALLPANIVIAVISLAVVPKLVARYGIKRPLVLGTLLVGGGLALLSRVSVDSSVMAEVIPCTLLVALGIGTAYNPLLLAALSGVTPRDSGAASGVVNTSFTLGGALGLAAVSAIAAARADHAIASGIDLPLALTQGYRLAYSLGALFAVMSAVTCCVALSSDLEHRK